MSSGILAPQIQIWPPGWQPQTAAAKNAPVHVHPTVVVFHCSELLTIIAFPDTRKKKESRHPHSIALA